MISGLYAAGTGMVARAIAMNHITSNISNANVNGYKKEEIVFHSFDRDLQDEVLKLNPFACSAESTGIDVLQGIFDFSQGALKYTGERNNMALEGEGFFTIDTGDGVLYSRNGTMHVNGNLELVTPQGYYFLNSDGAPIVFNGVGSEAAGRFAVDQNGEVYVVSDNGVKTSFGNLNIVKFSSPEKLEHLGAGMWRNSDNNAGILESDAKVQHRYLEISNANSVENMVTMILNQRIYNANANALKTIYQTIGNFISAMGG